MLQQLGKDVSDPIFKQVEPNILVDQESHASAMQHASAVEHILGDGHFRDGRRFHSPVLFFGSRYVDVDELDGLGNSMPEAIFVAGPVSHIGIQDQLFDVRGDVATDARHVAVVG